MAHCMYMSTHIQYTFQYEWMRIWNKEDHVLNLQGASHTHKPSRYTGHVIASAGERKKKKKKKKVAWAWFRGLNRLEMLELECSWNICIESTIVKPDWPHLPFSFFFWEFTHVHEHDHAICVAMFLPWDPWIHLQSTFRISGTDRPCGKVHPSRVIDRSF